MRSKPRRGGIGEARIAKEMGKERGGLDGRRRNTSPSFVSLLRNHRLSYHAPFPPGRQAQFSTSRQFGSHEVIWLLLLLLNSNSSVHSFPTRIVTKE